MQRKAYSRPETDKEFLFRVFGYARIILLSGEELGTYLYKYFTAERRIVWIYD